jgi:hypothetical protein
MGFCDRDALRLLLDAAKLLGAPTHRQTGVRLCVLEIDGEKIIFPPTPRLVDEIRSDGGVMLNARTTIVLGALACHELFEVSVE